MNQIFTLASTFYKLASLPEIEQKISMFCNKWRNKIDEQYLTLLSNAPALLKSNQITLPQLSDIIQNVVSHIVDIKTYRLIAQEATNELQEIRRMVE